MLQNLVIASTSLMTVLAFSLGIFCLVKNPKAKISVTWFLTSMAVTIWGIGYLLSLFLTSDQAAFRSLKIVYIGASLIPVLSFHFIASFLFKDKKYKYLLIFGYVLAAVFSVLILGTKTIIKGVNYLENFGRYEEVTTVGFKIFLAYFLFFAGYNIYLLIRGYRESDGIRRIKISYVLVASLIGFLGGISNFVMDLTGIYPYGQLIVWLYPVVITYGIFLR